MVKFLDNNNSGFATWAANRDAAAKRARSKTASFMWWLILFVASWWLLSSLMTPRAVDTATNTDSAAAIINVSNVPEMEINSDDITAIVQGLRIRDVDLLKFPAAPDTDTPVTMLGAENNFIEIGFIATGTTSPMPDTVWRMNGNTYNWRSPDGVEYDRTITTDGYVIRVTDVIKNGTKSNISIAPYARVVRTPDGASSAGVYTGAVAYVNNDIEHIDWRTLDKKAYAYSTTTGFAGFVDQYWETVVDIDSIDQTMRFKKLSDTLYSSDVAAAATVIASGDVHTFSANVFVGPRDSSVLSTVAATIVGINDTVDYGWFGFLVRPMTWVLNTLNALVMNYGIAIIIFTLILRGLMWPLTRKSYTSMMAMQKMQPEMARIQKLYANDKARMQMEMMRLYQTHKTSPMSGCLPMLIQIPIFFALYKALLISVQMRSAHFLWISDLAAMDPYFILPILMGGTMWLQQYLQSAPRTPANTNDVAAQTLRAMKWMPIIFTIMFAWMPAGLVLYWTVSNIFGIVQMYIIKNKTK